jgi:thiosulfate/3-mercaptopyruvate sulfurtransferase
MNNFSTISTEQLAALIGQPGTKILDCSVAMGRPEGDCCRINYLRSHIKGAQFLDLDNLRDMKNDLPFMMPSEEQFINKMKTLGVKMSDRVVCYDGGAMQFFGYRAAWMLQAMGHPNVQVLDGGYPKWVKEDLPIDSSERDYTPEDFGYKLHSEKIWNFDKVKAFEAA